MMESNYTILLLFVITVFAFVLNLPFGYLRGRTRKFSFLWFLYIHLPIPFVVIFRLLAGLSVRIIPLLLVAAIAGQVIGARIERFRCRHGEN